MALRRAAIAIVFACTLGACSFLTPLDGFVSPPSAEGGVASGTIDGSTTSDGGSASADATKTDDATTSVPPTNLHPNGDFETRGCDHWGAYQGTKQPADIGRTGAKSCRFCATDGWFFSGDDGSFLANPTPGRYHLEGWMRQSPGRPAPGNGVSVLLRTTNVSNGWQELETSESAFVPLTQSWTKVEIELVVTKPAENLNAVFAGQGGPNGACFLLDDVLAYKLP